MCLLSKYFVIRFILFYIVFSASFLLLKILGRYNRSQFAKWFVLDCSIHFLGLLGICGRLAVVRIPILFVALVFVFVCVVFLFWSSHGRSRFAFPKLPSSFWGNTPRLPLLRCILLCLSLGFLYIVLVGPSIRLTSFLWINGPIQFVSGCKLHEYVMLRIYTLWRLLWIAIRWCMY